VTDADPVARAAALAALGHRGSLTAQELARVADASARDPDERVRVAALGAVVRAAAGSAAPTWRVAMADRAAAVRRRAAELAPIVADDDADVDVVPSLVFLLDDRDVTVVEAAAWALGELDGAARAAGAVDALVAVAGLHRDALAREAAVAALGALGDPRALPTILGACTDKPAVRRRAVLALAPFDGAEVDAAIDAALADRDWQVRQAAEDLRATS
jgi:HEAT repeat protein